MKNRLSVIISAHNEENYLEKTLKSLKDNDFPFELVVVCDFCSDKTKNIANKYTDKFYEVEFKNISKTRNFGAGKSNGDILVFQDADTFVSKNYLKEISKAMKCYDYGCAKWKSESGNILGKYLAWTSNKYHKHKKTVGGNSFVKRGFFEKCQGFNEKMLKGEDTDFGDRLRNLESKYIFMNNSYQIPSERKYLQKGYLNLILQSWKEAFLYKFFRENYNKRVCA
jgi:cellulose synthase/poly-beta-1,6-N-acetylglucosamine synthase-like glycosyltransferase